MGRGTAVTIEVSRFGESYDGAPEYADRKRVDAFLAELRPLVRTLADLRWDRPDAKVDPDHWSIVSGRVTFGGAEFFLSTPSQLESEYYDNSEPQALLLQYRPWYGQATFAQYLTAMQAALALSEMVRAAGRGRYKVDLRVGVVTF